MDSCTYWSLLHGCLWMEGHTRISYNEEFAGPTVSSTQLIIMAISLGLFAGLLDSAVLLARKWMQVIVYLHQDLLWMKPLANLLVGRT